MLSIFSSAMGEVRSSNAASGASVENEVMANFNKYTASNSPLALPGGINSESSNPAVADSRPLPYPAFPTDSSAAPAIAGAAASATLPTPSSKNLLQGGIEYPALRDAGYNDYVDVMGNDALTYEQYIERKNLGGEGWKELNIDYAVRKIEKAFIESHPDAVALQSGDPIPLELSQAANNLYYDQVKGIYQYTEHDTGVKINKLLGGVKGVTNSYDELIHLKETIEHTSKALGNMSLPFDMVVYRGCNPVTFSGLEELYELNIEDWIGKSLKTEGFTSTSVYAETAYEREVIALIHVPSGKAGAGYVNDISFNLKNGLPQEYEVLLQKNSEYIIVNASKINGKIILELEWTGYAK